MTLAAFCNVSVYSTVAGHGCVELVAPHPEMCVASSSSNAVTHSDLERGLGGHPLGGVLPPATLEPTSPCWTACLHDLRIQSPAQSRHRTASGCCVQRVHPTARSPWSAVVLDHRGASVCSGSLTDEAVLLGVCGAAHLSRQDR